MIDLTIIAKDFALLECQPLCLGDDGKAEEGPRNIEFNEKLLKKITGLVKIAPLIFILDFVNIYDARIEPVPTAVDQLFRLVRGTIRCHSHAGMISWGNGYENCEAGDVFYA